MRTEIFKVINDFCPRIEEVRQSALDSGFATWKPPMGDTGHAEYDGMNFHGLHSLMLASLQLSTGGPVFPNNMFFRVTGNETDKAYVHSDRNDGAKTCIVYLSRHKEIASGTAFYQHRGTGWNGMPPVSWMRETKVSDLPFSTTWVPSDTVFDAMWADMKDVSPETWRETHRVSGEYNSALIFDAPLFHKRIQEGALNDSDSEKRMVWVCHYHTAETVENQTR